MMEIPLTFHLASKTRIHCQFINNWKKRKLITIHIHLWFFIDSFLIALDHAAKSCFHL